MPSSEPVGREEVRLIERAVGAAILCLLAAAIGALILEPGFGDSSADTIAVRGPNGPTLVKKGGIGPLPGASVPGYVARRAEELAQAAGRRVAVVSLVGYESEQGAVAKLGDAAKETKAILVALPGGGAEVVRDPLDEWAAKRKEAITADRQEVDSLAATTEDPNFREDYKARSAELAKQIEACDPARAIVFGVVVVAPADRLQALSRQAGVRLVDVGKSASVPSEVRGLRPEEVTTAGDPPARAL
jgi:hypothetical protein